MMSGAEDEVVDNDEDDDEVAVAKMRSISTAQHASYRAKLEKKSQNSRSSFFRGSFFGRKSSSKKKESSTPTNQGALSALKEEAEEEEEGAEKQTGTGFNGTWIQSTLNNQSPVKGNNPASVLANASLNVIQKIHINQGQLRFIEMTGNNMNTVIEDFTVPINASSFTSSKYLTKAIKVRAYWEGQVLVIHRIFSSDNYEVVQRRELEENDNIIRITSVRKNALSGIESESMTLFHRKK